MPEELVLFVRWEEFLKWLLQTTGRFPKKMRFTFTSRVDNLALDVLEEIIEVRYDRRMRRNRLRSINTKLEKLRVLLRICHDMRVLSNRQFEHAVRGINEVGGMVGSWLRGVED